MILGVADAQEAAQRFARYTGLLGAGERQRVAHQTRPGATCYSSTRTPCTAASTSCRPSLPWIAGTVLKSGDIAATGDYLRQSGVPVHVLGNQRLLVKLPPAVGGIIVFEPMNSGVLNFD